jgi:bacterioferritin
MAMSKVIDALNAARGRELTAILQYMEAHYELEDQQFPKLAKEMKKIAFVEMKHAEKLAERILYLNGTPNMKPDGEIQKGLDIAGFLELSKGLETDAIKMYNDSIRLCAAEGDDGSKEVFQDLLEAEEEHFDFFDNTESHVKNLGGAYIATLTEGEAD